MDIRCPVSGELIRKSQKGPSGFESRFLTEFEELGVLGAGGFGCVVKCRNKLDDQLYAIKKVVLDAEDGLSFDLQRSEILFLADFRDENVVRYYSSWLEANVVGEYKYGSDNEDDEDDADEDVNKPCLYIQQELCSTSLDKVLASKQLGEDEIWKIFVQMLKGINSIHIKGIRHGDLKPSNIFFVGEYKVKIGDFGLASVLNGVSPPMARGIYVAPEMKSDMAFTLNSDIYSLGMILMEMLVGFNFGSHQEKFEVLLNSEKREQFLESSDLPPMKKRLIKSLISETSTRSSDIASIMKSVEEVTKANSVEEDNTEDLCMTR